MPKPIVIELWPKGNCFICGVDLLGCRQGVPVYEDVILPNSWEGEWSGADACPECFAAQQGITDAWTRESFLAEFRPGVPLPREVRRG